MNDQIYLVITRTAITVMRRTRPNLYPGEIAIRLTINVPDSAFDSVIPAEITLEEDHIIKPTITIEIKPEEKEDE